MNLLLTAKIRPGTTSLIKLSDADIESHTQLYALPILPQTFFLNCECLLVTGLALAEVFLLL